jgi:hypothetical protein
MDQRDYFAGVRLASSTSTCPTVLPRRSSDADLGEAKMAGSTSSM